MLSSGDLLLHCILYLQLVQSLKQFYVGLYATFVLSLLQCVVFALRKIIYMSL